MSENEEKVQKDSQEPWDNSFSGNEPAKTSRVAHRRKTQQVRVIIGVLIAAVVVLSMVPVIGYLQTLNQPNSQEQSWSKAVTSETKVTSFSSDASKSPAKDAAKKAESEKKAEEAKKASEAAKNSSKTEAKNSSKSDNKDQKTVAVEAGQGAYRVAVNNGISVEKLRELNPGINMDQLSAGQMLRVK